MSSALLSDEDADAFRQLVAACYLRPDLFAEHVLGVSLRTWQLDACRRITEQLAAGDRRVRVLIRTCHGAGKTFFAAVLLLWWMATRYNARGLTTAPTWAQVEGTLWRDIASLYNGSLLRLLRFGRLLNTKLEFGETWFAIGASSDRPENLEGQHSEHAAIRVVDEAKAVEQTVFDATEGLLTSGESCDLWISTPSIEAGAFYERDMSTKPCIRAVVDVDQLINDPLIPPKDRKGFADQKQERLDEWGEGSAEYQSRVMARYIDNAEGQLFPSSWIERAMSQDWAVERGPRMTGLDPAGSVDGDQSAVATAVGPDDEGRFHVLPVTGWHERDTMVTKGRALAVARDAKSKLRVDTIGLGKGVADAARTNEFGVEVEEYRASDKARAPDRFMNRKAEDAWALRGRLEKTLVRLPNDQKLKSQMRGMKYEIMQSGKLRVVDPEDSPDLADAVIIATAPARIGFAAVYSEDM